MPFTNAGIADPAALRVLSDLLSKHLANNPNADREEAAAELLAAHRSGVTDENAMLARLRKIVSPKVD